MANIIEVGRVQALYRYPVKSMRGEAIAATHVWWHGFDGDRRYAFVRADDPSGFPWLTGRQVPHMVRYAPYFVEPENPAASAVRVRTPDGRDMAIEDSELLSEIAGRYGAGARLMQLKRGAYDGAGISLIGQTTIALLGRHVGRDLDPRRFRPNILVEPLDGQSVMEDDWLGARVIFGRRDDSARVRANRKDERCMMINLDPATATQDPEVLRAVVQVRNECAGIYGSVEAPGTICVGDVIRLVREPQGEPNIGDA
jgi:uncharacterized protein YcbX